ncbi:uncharacterized protein BDZ99DRAFT_566171 [Mytilinidion resinicola]|uniref:Rhodopsin domain-containing protein n=1 Tax=Mytilinidion resinicola TaxID=574789 RepID=A0A6A6Z6J1_9PEZI|nr:uncharacterized protein BDZ99DRAFT_566171 [Mytilinidion resinicola]KAF2816329.1 hypothetical protein BDZ99DRAFT_566171 [Mytilinidion resinicola]
MADAQEIRHDSVGHTVIALCIAFGAITTVIIFLRLFTRFWVIKTIGPDDGEYSNTDNFKPKASTNENTAVLITIASVLSWAFIAATIMAVNHGLGSHVEAVMLRGTQNMISYAQIVWFSSIFYNACLGFIKTSVLALYMRLGDRNLRRTAIVMTGVVGCQATANVLTCIFQCNPVSAAWDITITEKKCVNINAFYLANAALNIATDLLTYTLPVKLVIRLQVPRNQRIALGVMLCLGLFACISSIVRITFIPQMLVSPDATYVISGAMYWSVIETNVGIAAASIPSFKALAKRYAPVLLGSSHNNNQKYGSTGIKSGSGPFHKISNSTQNTSSVGDNSVKLRPLSHRDAAKGDIADSVTELPAYAKNSIATKIEQDRASNDSEEMLNVPDGRIIARTHITTHVEGSDEEESSFYSHENNSKPVGRGF